MRYQQAHLALDGKSLRRCWDRAHDANPLHLVQAWSAQHDAILGLVPVGGKENEIVALPKLLDLLNVEDHVVTIDAMGCQREIARRIQRQKGDYILMLKDNHPEIHGKVSAFFDDQLAQDSQPSRLIAQHEQVDSDHGRVETCKVYLYELQGKKDDWIRDQSNRIFPDLVNIIRVESTRYDKQTKKQSVENRHYLSSWGASAQQHNQMIRQHWKVESEHWVLDVAMKEDENRVQNVKAAMNLAVIRRVATAKLKAEKTAKVGVKNKALRCSADLDYLLLVLSS